MIEDLADARLLDAHRRFAGDPFFSALRTGALPKPALTTWLQGLSIIHVSLERSLAQAGSFCAPALGLASKAALLSADLDASDGWLTPSVAKALATALDISTALVAAGDDTLDLLGMLCVLEALQRSAEELKDSYALSLGVPSSSLGYIGCHGPRVGERWTHLIDTIRATTADAAASAALLQATSRWLASVRRLGADSYPFGEDDLRHHAAAVNYEAGDHLVPQDPRKIDLALRAGRRAWERFPYLRLRFGDRGKRFTSSDSCWLVALSEAPQDVATKSLQWLREVLSSRGIPTLVLEQHLLQIKSRLAEEFPESPGLSGRYDPFLALVEAEREALRGQGALAALLPALDERGRIRLNGEELSAGELLMSALIDEVAGVGSVAAIHGWLSARCSLEDRLRIDALVDDLHRAGAARC